MSTQKIAWNILNHIYDTYDYDYQVLPSTMRQFSPFSQHWAKHWGIWAGAGAVLPDVKAMRKHHPLGRVDGFSMFFMVLPFSSSTRKMAALPTGLPTPQCSPLRVLRSKQKRYRYGGDDWPHLLGVPGALVPWSHQRLLAMGGSGKQWRGWAWVLQFIYQSDYKDHQNITVIEMRCMNLRLKWYDVWIIIYVMIYHSLIFIGCSEGHLCVNQGPLLHPWPIETLLVP